MVILGDVATIGCHSGATPESCPCLDVTMVFGLKFHAFAGEAVRGMVLPCYSTLPRCSVMTYGSDGGNVDDPRACTRTCFGLRTTRHPSFVRRGSDLQRRRKHPASIGTA